MERNEITVGQTYVSGNTFAPTYDKVVAIVSWDKLPERLRKPWRTIEYWKTEEQFASREYVVSKRHGRLHSCPMDVWCGTAYRSNDEMIAAYAAKSGQKTFSVKVA